MLRRPDAFRRALDLEPLLAERKRAREDVAATDGLERADRDATRIRQAGFPLEEVIVGDPYPFVAVGDVLHVREFDEILFEEEPAREVVVA